MLRLFTVALTFIICSCSSDKNIDEIRSAETASLRQAPAGEFIGFNDKFNTHGWIGIPYAQAPEGALRWRAPQPLAPLKKTLHALQYSAICPQLWGMASGIDGKDGQVVGAEDCLYLNIWAPAMPAQQAATKDLPVMLWIHGGGNSIGTSNRVFPGHHLASDQNVIIVTINYRLNTLGWLSHPALRETASNAEDASGNFGTLDMVAALRWVQKNIQGFGGNPNNVTIFGESAGGHNVYALLGSPLAKGLFHKAIIQSGMASTETLSRAENTIDAAEPGDPFSASENLIKHLIKDGTAAGRQQAKTLLANMTASEIMAYLRNKPLNDYYQIFADSHSKGGMLLTPHHIRDGYVIPKASYLELFKDKDNYNHVPLIVGSTRDEGKLMTVLANQGIELKWGFFPYITDKEAHRRLSNYHSHIYKAMSVDEPLAVMSASQEEAVFAYRFDWDEWPYRWLSWLVDLDQIAGAVHGLDLGFVWGDIDSVMAYSIAHSKNNQAGRIALQQAMMSYWGHFAHTGNPSKGKHGTLPEWTPWQATGNKLMILDSPKENALRMSALSVTAADFKQTILNDPAISSQKELCQTYVEFLLINHHIDDFFDLQEYANFGNGGCKQYPPYSFYQAPIRE